MSFVQIFVTHLNSEMVLEVKYFKLNLKLFFILCGNVNFLLTEILRQFYFLFLKLETGQCLL